MKIIVQLARAVAVSTPRDGTAGALVVRLVVSAAVSMSAMAVAKPKLARLTDLVAVIWSPFLVL